MLGLWNVNWLNQNSQRAYPLAQQATRLCELSSDIQLPNDAILALRLCVHTGHDVATERFFIRSITVTGTGYTLVVHYQPTSGPSEEVAITHIPANTELGTYVLTGLGNFEDLSGYVAVDPQGGLANLGAGYYPFTYEATALEPDCVVPMLRSVSSLSVECNGSTLGPFYGDIVLSAGANILITPSTVGNTTILTIHARCSDPGYEDACGCDETVDMPCITNINGVFPDDSGSIGLEGVSCVSVRGADHTLSLTDVCADPHCGCDEMVPLAESIKKLEAGANTLEQLIQQLYLEVTQTASLASSSCFTVTNVRTE